MTTNFVFRALPGHAVGGPEELFNRVVELSTKLVVEGELDDFYPSAGARWADSSGPAVVVPIQGPDGWQYHQAIAIAEHGLRCSIYP